MGKHIALLVELPSLFTDDLDDYREYKSEFETESDWLENCIAVSGPVRLRVQVSGEKESDVVEVWGDIREVQLVDPSRGYSVDEPALTEDQLAKNGSHLLRDENACEWCMTCPEACDRDDD